VSALVESIKEKIVDYKVKKAIRDSSYGERINLHYTKLREIIQTLSVEQLNRHPEIIKEAKAEFLYALKEESERTYYNGSSYNIKDMHFIVDLFKEQPEIANEILNDPEVGPLQEKAFLACLFKPGTQHGVAKFGNSLYIDASRSRELVLAALKDTVTSTRNTNIHDYIYDVKLAIEDFGIEKTDVLDLAFLSVQTILKGDYPYDALDAIKRKFGLSDEDINFLIEDKKEELEELIYVAASNLLIKSIGDNISGLVRDFFSRAESEFNNINLNEEGFKKYLEKNPQVMEDVVLSLTSDGMILHGETEKYLQSLFPIESILKSEEAKEAAYTGIQKMILKGMPFDEKIQPLINRFGLDIEKIKSDPQTLENVRSSIRKSKNITNIKKVIAVIEVFEVNVDLLKKEFNNMLLRSLENKYVTSFKEILEYFEGQYTGYKKRFLAENKEELNRVIVASFETEGIKVHKGLKELEGQENIRFINIENNFLAEIIKQNQGQEKELLKGYFDCKAEGIIQESNYKDILELVDRLPILNITIVKKYLEAKSNQRETEYLDKIVEIADKMTSGGITEEEKSLEYFQDLLEYIYPNNIGNYANYKSVSTCQDRSQDLERFQIKEKYPIDIVDKGKLELREGRELDKSSLENIQKEREDIMKVYSEGGIENMRQRLDEIIEEMISKVEEENVLGIELDKLMNQEEKIYAIMLYSRLNKGIKAEDIKKSILYYNFVYLDNIERYQTYVDEGIEKRYEQIMELSEFYKDTIKEAQNIIIEKGKKNPIFEGVKENIYIENQERERRGNLGRLQVDKLGLNDKFIKDMRNILIKRRLRKDTTEEEKIELEKKYSLDRVREIISRYESMTGFLEEKASNSPDSNTKTFYGRLKGQRNKTLEAFKTLTGEEQDLLKTHLGNINLKEVIDLRISASNDIYDEELFDKLIKQSISNLYQEEYAILETEANKFILVDYDENGKKIEKKSKKLNAYISKDALSAYARMVGGVCVAGCNPDKGSKNIWDMPNYFQLVLQNPENKRCVGLVLLHHFEDENGQKVLSASYNPSSTYLFSVDEGTLFNELNNTLIEFAEENNFDKIVISKDGNIRTNRTGTIFETYMNKAIAQYKYNNNGDGTYSFPEGEDFSYYPTNYQLKDMDIVWSR